MVAIEVANVLSANFGAFFKRLNPSPTYVTLASQAQARIRGLLESRGGSAADLRVRCFLQGSYGRHTAIHTINDVDIVALCGPAWRDSANRTTRDQLFDVLSDAITADKAYRGKIRFGANSICIKVKLVGIKVEVLPALHAPGEAFQYEPFYMFRTGEGPRDEGWEPAFGRYHQNRLTKKNSATDGSFIPLVKVLKHVRSIDELLADGDAVSFHLECLLHAIRDYVYSGNILETIERVLGAIAGFGPDEAEGSGVLTPCRDKRLFSQTEWEIVAYDRFHQCALRWHRLAREANASSNEDRAIDAWQELFGESYFPRNVTE